MFGMAYASLMTFDKNDAQGHSYRVLVKRRNSRRAADLDSQGWSTDEPQRVSAQPLDRIMHSPKPIDHHERRPRVAVDQRATVFRGRNQRMSIQNAPPCELPIPIVKAQIFEISNASTDIYKRNDAQGQRLTRRCCGLGHTPVSN